MSTFQGLPTALFEFFADLAQDNSKDFWNANKQRWQRDVKAPMSALVDELSGEFGPLRMFRPNRDLRFARDKAPYKLWTGATSTPQATGGIGYYLSVSTTGITTGYGAMRMTADQLRRFRGAIDADISGIRFEELTQELARLTRRRPAIEKRTARLVDRPPPHRLPQMERGRSRSGLAHRHLDAHSPGAREDSRYLGRRRASQGMARRARHTATP